MWSPTMVLTRQHSGSLRRSDGMRCFQSLMAVDIYTPLSMPLILLFLPIPTLFRLLRRFLFAPPPPPPFLFSAYPTTE